MTYIAYNVTTLQQPSLQQYSNVHILYSSPPKWPHECWTFPYSLTYEHSLIF